MSRASNIKRADRMDEIDKIVVEILSEETDYRVQGGKAFSAILNPKFITKLPEEVIPYITSHDWNIIYLGSDFTGFVGKFFKAMDGLYSRINVADTCREGVRIVKKATFIKDEEMDEGDGGMAGGKKRVRIEPFLTISDGKSRAKWGVLSDTCDEDDMFVVDDIKYIGLCELMVRFTRMLSQDNRFLKDKGDRATTRLRVLLKAIEDKNGLVIDKGLVKSASFQTSLDKLRTYQHLKEIGIKPTPGKDEIFDGTTSLPKKKKAVAKSALSVSKPTPSRSLTKALSVSTKRVPSGTSKMSPNMAPSGTRSKSLHKSISAMNALRRSGSASLRAQLSMPKSTNLIHSMTSSVKHPSSPKSSTLIASNNRP